MTQQFTRDELTFLWDALSEYEHYQDPTAEPISKRSQRLMQKIEEMLDDAP